MDSQLLFRPTGKDVNRFLKKAPSILPFKRGFLVKQLLRIAINENADIISDPKELLKYDIDKGDEHLATRNADLKPVYVRFNQGDIDIVDCLDSIDGSKQENIKRLIRIALINNPELILRSGIISDVDKTFGDNPYLLSIYQNALDEIRQAGSKRETKTIEKNNDNEENIEKQDNLTSANPDIKVNTMSKEQMDKFASFAKRDY